MGQTTETHTRTGEPGRSATMVPEPENGRQERSILIVEDSPTQAQKLSYILESRGYRPILADNGREALTRIEKEAPTVVVSDIVMPQMDGFELCRRIKKNGHSSEGPVILLSYLSDTADIVRGLACGADNFVLKPYEPESLLKRIEALISGDPLQAFTATQEGLKVTMANEDYCIQATPRRIFDFLLSTYETAITSNQELARAQEELKALNDTLEQRVEIRTDALRREIVERRKAEEEIQRLNESLERRVEDRTTQLEAANRELEAFAYSVSHDLRAPLRAINGFSRALLEDYRKSLDEQGQDYLQRIGRAAARMAELIEDLLKLSRTTRGELKTRPVDLSALAHAVAEELRRSDPRRRVDFAIEEDLSVAADKQLLRVVLENLFGNAWKFTGKRDEARIELGACRDRDPPVYFVRDNGAGFDPSLAEKLFNTFQRLHAEEEFPGTGIGLAIVQRIIHKHGGQVCAEGEVGKGATFYFTLPENAPDRDIQCDSEPERRAP